MRLAILFVWLAGLVPQDAAKPGAAIVIGGGKDQPAIVKRIIELSGGPDARILVLPISTGSKDQPGEAMASFFREHGAKNVGVWIPESKEQADRAESLAELKAARGFYFGGGDQSRGMTLLRGTKALEAIRAAHKAGAAVAGSSAGAALMSAIMIEGGTAEGSISPGRYATSEGLGVTGKWITDQHFLQRGRMQRLINVLLDNPGSKGVGVDERTAAVFTGDTVEVVGQGQVVLFEPPAGVSSRPAESRPLYRADDIRMRVLAPGDKVKL